MRAFFFALIASLTLPMMGIAQIAQIIPVDEAQQDPELLEFRDRLLEAVVARDVDYIVSISHPDITLDFGGGAGRDTLRQRLGGDGPVYSEDEYGDETAQYREDLWLGFESALRLGGIYDADEPGFVAPHYFAADTGDLHYDAFFTDFIVTDNVAVRDRPNRYGTVIDRLDYELVERLEGGEGTSYGKVALEGGRSGYVHRDLLRSVVDYRALFAKIDGKWMMTVLIAGD